MKRLLFLLLCLFLLAPASAWAADEEWISLDDCTSTSHEEWHYTSKVVDCVETTIGDATIMIMEDISDFMTPIVAVMTTLAIVFFGMRILGGEPELLKKGMGFLLRLTFVLIFSYNLGGFAEAVFGLVKWSTQLVSGGSPWEAIDTLLGKLIGFAPGYTLSKGLLAVIGAALTSSTSGAIFFFIATSAIINLMLFCFRVVFTYLSAILAIGFLIAISPLIIPMAMFKQYGERYLIKWADIIVSTMLVPIFLFAFLIVFVNLFDPIVHEIFELLCGRCADQVSLIDFSGIVKLNQPQYSWLVPSDPNILSQLQGVTDATQAGTPAIQTNMNPFQRFSHDTNMLRWPGLNLGPSDVSLLQQLIYSFASLWIFASFMKSLVDKIPDIAYNITDVSSHISTSPSKLEKQAGSALRSVQTAITGRG